MRIGLAGFGSVGQAVALRLSTRPIDGIQIVGITARDLSRAGENAPPGWKHLVGTLDEVAEASDLVVECATAEAFPDIARNVVQRGRKLIAVSAAGLLAAPDLLELARAGGGRIHIVSGALPGMDLVRSAKEGSLRHVVLTTRLRPESLRGEDFIVANRPDLAVAQSEAALVFQGSAADAGAAFPRHFNVAVTLALGGIGLERTRVELWSDPTVSGSVHELQVIGDEVSATMISRNIPSLNPRTSKIVALSVVAALRAEVDSLVCGG